MASALGQPLKADIELAAVNQADKASLVARLASPDIYREAGLEYPYGSKFKFQIESRANGESYIKVSSAQPINDPFVSMLVELTWASGKLLREYTFLLDPPDYVAERPRPIEIQAVVAAPAAVAAKPVEQTVTAAPAPVESESIEKTAAAPVKLTVTEAKAKGVSSGIITVQCSDTLNKIAIQNKPAEVSLERMLVALYRANTDEFDGKNMNRIKAGKILRMPVQSEIQDVSQANAVREIHAQVADWNAYRQKLAGAASAASQTQETLQVATGKIASSVADKTPVTKEPAKEVLKLSKGEAQGDNAAAGTAGKSMSAQGKKNSKQEDTIAKSKGLKEEQVRATLLEKNLKDMQRLTQLKSEAAALAQSPATAPAVAAASSVAAASEVKPAPVANPKPKPVAMQEPFLVDKILGEPLYLIGGLVMLLGLGGIGFILSRHKQASAASGKSEDAGAVTCHLTTPFAPSPETGDFTSAAAARTEATSQPDEVDPISEADMFLNFGRDVQAEEILKEALHNTPNNHYVNLKLLSTYANRKDVNHFSTITRQLKDPGDETAWQQAAAMGRKLDPNNPMCGGAGTIEDDGSATMQTTVLSAMPNFVLGDTAATQNTAAPNVDFDLGDTEKTSALSTGGKAVAKAEAMDFDVSTHPLPVAPVEMDFDVTSTRPPLSVLTEMYFDIISTSPSMPEAGLAGISLNLDDIGALGKPAPETRDEHWHKVATKLDLAKAYQEMGNTTGAREILDEVLREGDEVQRKAAQSMLYQLG